MSTLELVRRSPKEHLAKDLQRRAEDYIVSNRMVWRAIRCIDAGGMAPVLEDRLTARTGRPRHLKWRPFLILLMLGGVRLKGEMVVAHIHLITVALTPKQREMIGLPEVVTYAHLESNLADLSHAIKPRIHPLTGEVLDKPLGIDETAFMNAIISGSLPKCLTDPDTVAVDSTDVEAQVRRRSTSVDDLPDVEEGGLPQAGAQPANPRSRKGPRQAGEESADTRSEKDWPKIGDDGRLQHTADPDVRVGFRSRKEGGTDTFLGYDLHTVVDVPRLGQPAVPGVIRAASLARAGSSKTTGGMLALRDAPESVELVACDRGYSYRKDWGAEIWRAGLRQVFDLHKHQRGVRPGPKPGIIKVDGGYYSSALPEHLRNLPLYRRGMSDEEKLELAKLYDERSRWACTPMGSPDSKGNLRLRGPAITERVRCCNVPKSMRRPRGHKRPTTSCTPGECGCGITFTVPIDDWSWDWQWPLYGTTRWLKSYDRRPAVESTNAEIRTNRFRFHRGCVRVKGETRTAILLAFMLAALNMAMTADWFGTDWLELMDAETPPLKLVRRSKATVAKHRRTEGPPG